MAAVMEEYMQGRKFLVGDTLTIADIVGAYTLDWANEVQLLDDFPHLLRYMERMYARPNTPLRIAEAFARINS
jgi:glutathione S-transferase